MIVERVVMEWINERTPAVRLGFSDYLGIISGGNDDSPFLIHKHCYNAGILI
jgi:hypothetical protein